jgi:hypothetical protein
MAASFIMIVNGVKTEVTSAGLKTNTAHGNPAGEGTGTGKFTVKVRSSGPASGN